MKKKIIGVTTLVAIGLATAWSIKQNHPQVEWNDLDMENVKAMAINDMCPNGCTSGEDGCYCNGFHKANEYSWP